MKEPRVFLLADNPRFNTEPAESFGDRVFLFRQEPNPFDVERLQIEVLQRMARLGFDPKRDFVALTGSSVQVALFLSFITGEFLCKSSIRVLLFDARTDSYQSKRIQKRRRPAARQT